MAEFTLPKNSRITQGKTWPKPENAMTGAGNTPDFV